MITESANIGKSSLDTLLVANSTASRGQAQYINAQGDPAPGHWEGTGTVRI